MRIKYYFSLILLLFGLAQSSHAGLISAISKAGKHGDIDVPTVKLGIPKQFAAYEVLNATPKFDGTSGWNYKNLDGEAVTLGNPTKQLIVVDIDRVPRQLDFLQHIPDTHPIMIKSRHGKFIQIQRKPNWHVVDDKVKINVKDTDSLREAVNQLHRPIFTDFSNFWYLGKASDGYVQAGTPKAIAANEVLSKMSSMKNQTITLAGNIQNGKLILSGKSTNLSVDMLKHTAEKYDINLILLESAKAKKQLTKLAKQQQKVTSSPDYQYDTTASFFNRMAQDLKQESLELQIAPSGSTQVMIQPTIKSATADSIAPNALWISLKLATLYRPNDERAEDLENRIISWLPSSIQTYLIISLVIGFFSLQSSFALFYNIWVKLPAIKKWELRHSGKWWNKILRLPIFIFIYLPILGILGPIYWIRRFA